MRPANKQKIVKTKPGDVFGRLTVLEEGKNDSHGYWYVCRCECGNTKEIRGSHLRSGVTQSCGCLRSERTAIATSKHRSLFGKIFGRWTVLGPKSHNKNRDATWACLCSCGNASIITENSLLNGSSTSCGCSRKENQWGPHRPNFSTDSDGPEDRTQDYRYKPFVLAVLKRDNFTCQKCGTVGGRLHVHHLDNFKNYPKLRYNPDNGITLCYSCHLGDGENPDAFHKVYGCRGTTKEMFFEWLYKKDV